MLSASAGTFVCTNLKANIANHQCRINKVPVMKVLLMPVSQELLRKINVDIKAVVDNIVLDSSALETLLTQSLKLGIGKEDLRLMMEVQKDHLLQLLEKYRTTLFTRVMIFKLISIINILKTIDIEWPELISLLQKRVNELFAEKLYSCSMMRELLQICIEYDLNITHTMKLHKAEIIKRLLLVLADKDDLQQGINEPQRIDLINSVIYSAEMLGMKWPEFAVIKHSTQALISDITESVSITDETMDRLNNGLFGGIYYMASFDITVNDLPEAGKIIHQNKHKIISKLLFDIKEGVYMHAKYLIRDLKTVGITWVELDIILKSIKTDQLKEASIKNNGKLPTEIVNLLKHDVFLGIRYLASFDVSINELPEYKKLIENKKHIIIRKLLEYIKSNRSPIHIVEDLQSIGITWPELDILQKSLNSDDLLENTDDYSAYDNDYTVEDQAIDMFDHGVISGIDFMAKYDLTIHNLPKANDLIEREKSYIITRLLRLMKSDYHFIVNQNIKRIKKVGITWPELDIIQKSVDFENSTQIDETHLLKNDTILKWFIDNIRAENHFTAFTYICKD